MSEYSADMIEMLSAEPETEPHIVIAKDRTVIVPDELKEIAAQFEHNIETVTFDCPRYWDEHDLSTMHIYVNCMCADGNTVPFLCEPPTVDEVDNTIIHFKWTITRDVTCAKGTLSFLVCAKRADTNGVLQNQWGSRLNQEMEILEGFECNTEEVVTPHKDIIEQILYRLETASESAERSATAAQASAERAIAAANGVEASNPNLIDNWYFADPVNQRGQTEYANNGYSVDRWYQEGRLVCNDGFITHTPNQWYEGIRQNIEPYVVKAIAGQKVTLSMLARSALANDDMRIAIYDMTAGELESTHAWMTVTNKWDVISATFTVPESYLGHTVAVLFSTSTGHASSGGSTDIIAVKAELGDKHTIAHQDANGNWVLNDPPPDKGMELMKCCMSTVDPTDDHANNKKTPAAVGAVNKAGDTMTGNLGIKKSDSVSVSFVPEGTGFMAMTYSDWNKRRFLWLPADNASAPYDKLQYVDMKIGSTGVNGRFDILHIGNKPSGSYTGNGSAAARTVATGGIGKCCMVYGGTNEMAYVTPLGAFYSSGGIVLFTADVTFDGTLHISSDAIINTTGIVYNYQVL